MKQESFIGTATQEQIDQWKRTHTEVFSVKVGGHIAYLKKPDRETLAMAGVVAKDNPIKFNEIIFNHCFLGGSEEIVKDDSLFLGAGATMAHLIEY